MVKYQEKASDEQYIDHVQHVFFFKFAPLITQKIWTCCTLIISVTDTHPDVFGHSYVWR